jgi:divalent metal cation (Fe/Co/Zn/Cd) transporter
MKSKKGVKLSQVLGCFVIVVAGFAIGLNVGSQFFTERPDVLTLILVGLTIFSSIIIPFVRKKENEDKK